jgi:hypothetical protein
MATHVLNIGTDRSHVGKPTLTEIEVIEAVVHMMRDDTGAPVKIEWHASDTERTAVVTLRSASYIGSGQLRLGQLRLLAETLDQECIAERWEPGSSFVPQHRLHGPKAKAWGPFDPTKFIMPGGARLEEPAADLADHPLAQPLTFHEIKEGLVETGEKPEAAQPRAEIKPFFRLLGADNDLSAERIGDSVVISRDRCNSMVTLSASIFEQIIAAYGATK